MESDTYSKHWRYLGLDLKRGYQAGLCWSMLIVYGAIIIAIATLTMWPKKAANQATSQIYMMHTPDTTEVDAQGVAAEKNPSGAGTLATLLPENYPCGFMPNIEIIRENSPPSISASAKSRNYAHEPILEKGFSGIDPLSDFEESNVAGYGTGDSDDGLPPGMPYLPPIPHSLSMANFNTNMRPEKGLIMLAAIYWPTVASKNDTGYVEIILDIDHKGRIQWWIKKEQPKGKGFASALEDALKRSKYNPPTNENGKKIPVRLTLSSTICYNCPPYFESTVSNMEAVQLPPNR